MYDKTAIRSEYLLRRRSLTSDEVHTKSAAIVARLLQLPNLAQPTTILVYVASKDNEVDTKPLILATLAAGKTVLVPCSGPAGILTWSSLHAWEELAPGPFGILEPRRDIRRLAAPPSDAPVIVPGLAFSPHGHRIGYGKGYYDRFLVAHSGLKIGLAYDLQLTDRIQPCEHDVPLDIIVTESTLYDCRP